MALHLKSPFLKGPILVTPGLGNLQFFWGKFEPHSHHCMQTHISKDWFWERGVGCRKHCVLQGFLHATPLSQNHSKQLLRDSGKLGFSVF